MLDHHAGNVVVPATGILEAETASDQTLAQTVRMSRLVDERGPLKRCTNHLSKDDVVIHQLDDKIPCIGLSGHVVWPLHFERLPERIAPQRLKRSNAK